jgi:transcriptional regulator with XRE-family HTH domain
MSDMNARRAPTPDEIARGTRIRIARKAKGVTHKEVADHLGVTESAVSQWEAGRTFPGPTQITRLATYLQVSVTGILTGIPEQADGVPAADNHSDIDDYPVDVPVYGVERIGLDGAFLVTSHIVERLKRLPGIAKLADVYSINIVSDRMAPWAREGDVICISPSRPPSVGSMVVVTMRDEKTGSPTTLIKEYLGRAGTSFKLRQYNPDETVTVDGSRIVSMHRVLTLRELIGQ